MKLSKAEKFTLIIFGLVALGLYVSYSQGYFTFDLNGLLNGTLQSLVAGIVMVPITIMIYRYLYHKKSKT